MLILYHEIPPGETRRHRRQLVVKEFDGVFRYKVEIFHYFGESRFEAHCAVGVEKKIISFFGIGFNSKIYNIGFVVEWTKLLCPSILPKRCEAATLKFFAEFYAAQIF